MLNNNVSNVLFQNTQTTSFDASSSRPTGCRRPSEMFKTSHTKDKSSCPWRYKRLEDPNRIPSVLRNATLKSCIKRNNYHCIDLQNGNNLAFNNKGKCVPIVTENLVIHNTTCIDGSIILKSEKITLVTGFTCIYSPVRIFPVNEIG